MLVLFLNSYFVVCADEAWYRWSFSKQKEGRDGVNAGGGGSAHTVLPVQGQPKGASLLGGVASQISSPAEVNARSLQRAAGSPSLGARAAVGEASVQAALGCYSEVS